MSKAIQAMTTAHSLIPAEEEITDNDNSMMRRIAELERQNAALVAAALRDGGARTGFIRVRLGCRKL